MSQRIELNDGHLIEIADRLHLAISMIEQHLKAHPVVTTCFVIESAIEQATDLLSFAYQHVGEYESVNDIPGYAPPPSKLTKEKLAEQLTGIEYPPDRHISKETKAAAKKAGLLIVYGLSDDLVEFDGAFTDEIGAYNGTISYVDKRGVLGRDDIADFVNREPNARKIEAIWAPGNSYSWMFKTDIPHATFEIVEGGGPYCRGIVIDLADLTTS